MSKEKVRSDSPLRPAGAANSRDASGRPKGASELKADALDVHILDLLAEIEALLRNVREIQRAALRLRGVPVVLSSGDRSDALTDIQKRVNEMRSQCRSLESALEEAARTAADIVVT